MSHFAKIENNIVTFVTVGRQEDDGKEQELCERTGDIYRQTSYNTRGGVHYTDGEPSTDQSKRCAKTMPVSDTPSMKNGMRSFRLSRTHRGYWMKTLAYGRHLSHTRLMVACTHGMKHPCLGLKPLLRKVH
jgi:hypothetical protein